MYYVLRRHRHRRHRLPGAVLGRGAGGGQHRQQLCGDAPSCSPASSPGSSIGCLRAALRAGPAASRRSYPLPRRSLQPRPMRRRRAGGHVRGTAEEVEPPKFPWEILFCDATILLLRCGRERSIAARHARRLSLPDGAGASAMLDLKAQSQLRRRDVGPDARLPGSRYAWLDGIGFSWSGFVGGHAGQRQPARRSGPKLRGVDAVWRLAHFAAAAARRARVDATRGLLELPVRWWTCRGADHSAGAWAPHPARSLARHAGFAENRARRLSAGRRVRQPYFLAGSLVFLTGGLGLVLQ